MKTEIIEYDPFLFQKYKASRSKKVNNFDDDIRYYKEPKLPKPIKAPKPPKPIIINKIQKMIIDENKKREEKNKKRREHYQLTREKQLEYKKQWALKHADEIKENRKLAYWVKTKKDQ